VNQEHLWVEKYRPRTIEECILPISIKSTFQDIINSGEMQNLLLSGKAGCGKTTVARALCNELGCENILINCSEDGNIDTLRTKIRNFASTVSFSDQKKVVILDEFDYSNAQSTQPALRGFVEEFSKNCRFVLTCNYKNRIIEPIHSRCTNIEFKIESADKPKLAKQFFDRCSNILKGEEIPFKDKALSELVIKHFPDFRRILNELQRYSVSGQIDEGILTQIGEVNIKNLMESMKNKDFTNVRKWVVENLDNDPVQIFRKLYDCLYDNLTSHSIPQAILVIAEYQYKAAFVADAEINLTACLIEIMMECEFK
tara:strand:- start:2247 stop:3185 length:939 start_codon:yes stop_codon:yes gene_type:complete